MSAADEDRSEADAEWDRDVARKQEQGAAAEGELAQARPDVDDAEAVDPASHHQFSKKGANEMYSETKVPNYRCDFTRVIRPGRATLRNVRCDRARFDPGGVLLVARAATPWTLAADRNFQFAAKGVSGDTLHITFRRDGAAARASSNRGVRIPLLEKHAALWRFDSGRHYRGVRSAFRRERQRATPKKWAIAQRIPEGSGGDGRAQTICCGNRPHSKQPRWRRSSTNDYAALGVTDSRASYAAQEEMAEVWKPFDRHLANAAGDPPTRKVEETACVESTGRRFRR